MDTEATEGDIITINCTVESFPLSKLTLTRTSSLSSLSELIFQPPDNQQLNKLHYEVKATAAHTGFYICNADNNDGSQSMQKKLVVKCKEIVLVLIRAHMNLKNFLENISSYLWITQMLPKRWRSNLNPVLLWEKTWHWLCTAMLSPTLRCSHFTGWRWLMGSLKPLGMARPSHWTRSALLTADFIGVQPQMKLELEALSKLQLK